MLEKQVFTAQTLVNRRLERRGQLRQVALLRVALLHADEVSDICVVKNVSPNGLSARVYRKLTAGEQVQIEFRSGELLAGSVVWEDKYNIGIVFPEPIDVTAVLASRWATEASKRRALPRIKVECPGRLDTGLRSMGFVLGDISQCGASLETETQLPNCSTVVLSLPDLPPIAGVVRWTLGARVGVSFNECIAFEHLARWIQARREGLGLNKIMMPPDLPGTTQSNV
jgi:hypothetical protein